MRKRRLRKYIGIMLIAALILMMLPIVPQQAQALERADDFEVKVGSATVGNLNFEATNAFQNFNNDRVPGFSHAQKSGANIDWFEGGVYSGAGGWTTDTFVLDVSQNDTLKAMAQSGHAKLNIGFNELAHYEGSFMGIPTWTRITDISITHKHGGSTDEVIAGRNLGARHATVTLAQDSVITITVTGEEDDEGPTGVRGLYLKFEDKQRPVMESYTFTGDGNERYNAKIGQMELYVKQQENITLAYNFTEPVRPSALQGTSAALHEHFLRHPLFTNPDGTGLPAQGQQMYLTNITFNSNNLNTLHKDIAFRYVGSRYHNSGNNPLEPKIAGVANGVSMMDQTIEQKFAGAVLADAAGNVAITDFPNEAGIGSNSYLAGKTVNPFDFKSGGYRVIVDGVAPKYTKSGNGITPEIVTGVVLNQNDFIEFTIKFTEEAMIREGWDVDDTFIYLNNGMKAKYTGGENSDTWTFRMDISDQVIQETPLLKVIRLTNESKPGITDKDVVSDYAGNLLIQPANLLGEHTDGDTSLVNSTIDWAQLSIDNTAPVIGFRFDPSGATDGLYQKNGQVTIDANDPTILLPELDPLVKPGDQLKDRERPSQGIYRPSNMTGSQSPSVGLVYYYWSQDPQDPFLGKEADNWAAVKRYSLAAKQPSEELYPEGFEHVQLQAVNNKTNMIAPPSEALTEEGSGIWYLHSWTADMTWDSARELMQYEKMEQFVLDNPQQYKAWKDELTGASEAEKTFYANNKALAAVGQYGDTNLWPLSDFKQVDSNWTYNVTPIRLDNKGPDIVFDEYSGDGTMNVLLTTELSDPHSGIKDVYYQWVTAGSPPQDMDWKHVTLADGSFTASTLNEVFEDGEYQLYVKAIDYAGNESVKVTGEVAVVSSASSVSAGFDPESNPGYTRSHDINFWISGIVPDKVAYAFGDSSIRPGSEASYTELTAIPAILSIPEQPEVGILSLDGETGGIAEGTDAASPESGSDSGETGAETGEETSTSGETPADPGSGEAPLTGEVADEQPEGPEELAAAVHQYVIPAAPDKEGMQYVHVMAKEGDRYFYYSKAYYFDNQPPAVAYSKSGVAYPLESHDVAVTVSEPYSTTGLTKEYQWIKAGEAEPTAGSAGWTTLPDNGKVMIDNSALASGEIADFRLYVKAADGAGNTAVSSTPGIFKVSRAGDDNTPPAESSSELIYLYGDEYDGYTAVLELTLATEDKRGYEYSISPDNGETWQKWRPYTNFVSVKVPTNIASELRIQVKYRTPGGVIGEAEPLIVTSTDLTEPVYAIATLNTTRPVNSSKGVEIQIAPPLGVKVNASAVNPSAPVRKGNVFTVRENGYYSFDLTDLNNSARTATLYVVVNNIDDIAPEGTIEYRVTEKTSGNVPVQLASTSEPVVILNNSGKSTFVFTENGSFTFMFRDEAGNIGQAAATVANIDKEAPQVRIVASYTYGANNSDTFGTIKDENGNVLLASGVKLEVVKAEGSSKTIRVIDKSSSVIVRQNGIVSFTVADEFGNTTVVEAEVNNILTDSVEPQQIAYTFVDEAGNPLPEDRIVTINGQPYAKGRVQVTLTGRTALPNAVFAGVRPIEENGVYTNQISGEDGTFTYSRTYSTNGSTLIGLSDLLGNVSRVPVTVTGLDNKAPELALAQAAVAVVQNKSDFDFRKDLGGYSVSDNVSASANIDVAVSGLDLTKLGRQRVTYTATDEVGNQVQATQDVIVVSDAGMLVFANNTLISGDSGESALFDTNKLTFNISRYNVMEVDGQELVNERGTYDVLYYSGLYREGQMKLIATKVTYEELIRGQYEVVFPQAGWYTIVVRNQERERVYATFFISKTE